MLNYLRFDVKRYLEDYESNVSALDNMERQLAELSELKGMNESERVQSSPSPDGLENYALRKIKLKAEISAYKEYINTFKRAFLSLTEDEQKLLDMFYIHPLSSPLRSAMDMYGYEKTQIYTMLNQAMNKFSKQIYG